MIPRVSGRGDKIFIQPDKRRGVLVCHETHHEGTPSTLLPPCLTDLGLTALCPNMKWNTNFSASRFSEIPNHSFANNRLLNSSGSSPCWTLPYSGWSCPCWAPPYIISSLSSAGFKLAFVPHDLHPHDPRGAQQRGLAVSYVLLKFVSQHLHLRRLEPHLIRLIQRHPGHFGIRPQTSLAWPQSP